MLPINRDSLLNFVQMSQMAHVFDNPDHTTENWFFNNQDDILRFCIDKDYTLDYTIYQQITHLLYQMLCNNPQNIAVVDNFIAIANQQFSI